MEMVWHSIEQSGYTINSCVINPNPTPMCAQGMIVVCLTCQELLLLPMMIMVMMMTRRWLCKMGRCIRALDGFGIVSGVVQVKDWEGDKLILATWKSLKLNKMYLFLVKCNPWMMQVMHDERTHAYPRHVHKISWTQDVRCLHWHCWWRIEPYHWATRGNLIWDWWHRYLFHSRGRRQGDGGL